MGIFHLRELRMDDVLLVDVLLQLLVHELRLLAIVSLNFVNGLVEASQRLLDLFLVLIKIMYLPHHVLETSPLLSYVLNLEADARN